MHRGLAILAVMVGLSIAGVVPLVSAVIIAALAAIFTGCVTVEE